MEIWKYSIIGKQYDTLFIAAFGNADRLYISYRSSWSSVKLDTNTL